MKRLTFLRTWMVLVPLLLPGCGSMGGVFGEKPKPPVVERQSTPTPAPEAGSGTEPPKSESKPGKGGYYLDDGPGDTPPADIDAIPDAVPRVEALLARANRPYTALGESYTPMTEYRAYRASGIASWYGRRYHGQKTSSGEIYDMYGMTAAHPLLPIPSYVRVTNPDNGRSVVVRVNDRGPFKKDRLIDLSYAAAYKLRLIAKGSGTVDVEAVDPLSGDTRTTQPNLSLDKSIDSPAAQGSGTFVQVGAFRQKDNADQLRDRIGQSGLVAGVAIETWYNEGVHRVRLGPYANRTEAERAAEQLRQALGFNPILTTRP